MAVQIQLIALDGKGKAWPGATARESVLMPRIEADRSAGWASQRPPVTCARF